MLTGTRPTGENSALQALLVLGRKLKAKYYCIKMGNRGAFMFDGKEYFVYPAENVIPVDTTAAGDTFVGYFVAEISKGKEPCDAIKTACAAAAITVSRKGAAPSIPKDYEVPNF